MITTAAINKDVHCTVLNYSRSPCQYEPRTGIRAMNCQRMVLTDQDMEEL